MPTTTIRVRYPRTHGDVGLRGSAPLRWDSTTPPTRHEGNVSVFELEVTDGVLVEFKAVRQDGRFSGGRNHTVLAGETARAEPYFDATTGSLDAEPKSIRSPQLGRDLRYRVFLPPSYRENEGRSYPVLYAQDGQSLFADSRDPFDGSSWCLDGTLDELWDLGAIDEMIVVAVHTDEDRLAILSPSPDPDHGGGRGPDYLSFLTDTLKPFVDTFFRTMRDPESTAVMGSSMGGLFSFYAAWTRHDVFGKAACLSSSFWWNRRWMIHEVERDFCPVPPPLLYIDSGAAKNATEEDANLRDGYHHTMALRKALVGHCYMPGTNLHVLAFPGHRHDNASWAARLGVPLQLLFPPA